MATNLNNLLPFPATVVRPSAAAPSHLLTGLPSRKRVASCSASASSSGSKWWTPLFGWSPEPDYVDTGNDETAAAGKTRLAPGCFTAEKAKQLRIMTKETETFHDVMYHSAIASRLALDSESRSDP